MDLFFTVFESRFQIYVAPSVAKIFLAGFKGSRYRCYFKKDRGGLTPEFKIFFDQWAGLKDGLNYYAIPAKNIKIFFKKSAAYNGECHGPRFFGKIFTNKDAVFVDFKKNELFFLINPNSLRTEKPLEKYFEFLIQVLIFLNIKSGQANLFHGTVLKTGRDKCVLIVGSSGQGKSTLASNWSGGVLADEWSFVKRIRNDYWVYPVPFFWQNRRLGQRAKNKKARLDHVYILDRLRYLPDRKLSLAEKTGFFLINGLHREPPYSYLINRQDLSRRIDFIRRICYTKNIKIITRNCLGKELINLKLAEAK